MYKRQCNEKRYGELEPDTVGHRVVVVGGGPGGMMAAETLAKRGVKVTLMDRQESLGGTVNLAKRPPLKERMEWIADYYRDSFARLGVEVQLGKEASPENIAALEPDAVVLATGSRAVFPKSIPGVDGKNVYTVEEVLTGKADIAGKSVAMIGAGLTGLEVGEFLGEKGCKVAFVDMLKQAGANAYRKMCIRDRLHIRWLRCDRDWICAAPHHRTIARPARLCPRSKP